MAKRRRSDVNATTFSSFSAPRDAAVVTYAGDKPNPALRRFVEESATPFDPETDSYDVPAFNQPIQATKATAIYNMHSYHQGKKPHDAIRQYIRHYTKPGDLVMDPFSGSGSTALAALMEGRSAIAIDRSPAATFITKNYCSLVQPDELRRAYETIKRRVQPEFEWLYETRCDRCDGKATTGYTVYSQVFQCPRCLQRVALFDCVEAQSQTAAGKPKSILVCPYCFKQDRLEEISTRSERFGSIPVLVSYYCQDGCTPSRGERRHNDAQEKKRQFFQNYDLGKIQEIESKSIPHWYPNNKMMNVDDDTKPWGAEWRQGRNFRRVSELYTKRNLWALASFRAVLAEFAAPESDGTYSALWPLITSVSLTGSRMLREQKRAIQSGTYYLPGVFREIKIENGIDYNMFQLLKAKEETLAEIDEMVRGAISTQSSTDLGSVASNSLDYIFTDPPYSENVQYGELNFVWESWLGFDTHWHDEEIIVNEVRGVTEADWAERMRHVMAECYRVLKPGRWLSLCYHDTSEGTWALVQDIMAEVGFVVDKTDSALYIDSSQKSYNQRMADKATKRDLVLNFRKPKVAPTHYVARIVDGRTFSEVARQVVRDFLTAHPGTNKDRIYDELVSRLIQSGKMEAHDFDSLLRSVAEEVREPVKKNLFENEDPDLFGSHVHSRWYLKDTADEVDQAEQEKEDAAAARLEAFILKHLKKHPEDEGVHYTNLQEEFFAIPVALWPRRKLFDWLPEYFFKTIAGTWRPPADDREREQKAALRQTGTLRRIKRFANALIDGVPVRDKDRPGSDRTLADWIRQCRRAGLFEQGRALYEKGGLNLDRLGEVEQIEAEDDYRICARRGSAAEVKLRRKRRTAKDD